MKKVLFVVIAIVSFVNCGTAQEKIEINKKADFKSASLITTFDKEITEYKFISLVELDEEADQIIRELDLKEYKNSKTNTCEIKIEIKIELSVGTAKGLVSGSIITGCAEAADATKHLKTILLAVAMG